MSKFLSLIKNQSTNLKKIPLNSELVFGKTFTDHMLSINYDNGSWGHPTISPYKPISLDPSATVFHYSVACFEGMKAYKDSTGKIRLFRPDMNMTRSCTRLALPSFEKPDLLECIKQFVKIEKAWIPNQKGYSLYIRPTAIGTQASLGVGPSKNSMIFVIASPVGPYYKTGFSAVSLYASPEFVRAWPVH